jgi:hypothetical protein
MFGRHGVALAFRYHSKKVEEQYHGKILSLSAFQLTILKTNEKWSNLVDTKHLGIQLL